MATRTYTQDEVAAGLGTQPSSVRRTSREPNTYTYVGGRGDNAMYDADSVDAYINRRGQNSPRKTRDNTAGYAAGDRPTCVPGVTPEWLTYEQLHHLYGFHNTVLSNQRRHVRRNGTDGKRNYLVCHADILWLYAQGKVMGPRATRGRDSRQVRTWHERLRQTVGVYENGLLQLANSTQTAEPVADPPPATSVSEVYRKNPVVLPAVEYRPMSEPFVMPPLAQTEHTAKELSVMVGMLRMLPNDNTRAVLLEQAQVIAETLQ